MATASEPQHKGHASGGTVTPDPAIPVEPRKDIALLWVEIDGDSEILREVGAEGSLHLPFAVCGAGNVERLVRREKLYRKGAREPGCKGRPPVVAGARP